MHTHLGMSLGLEREQCTDPDADSGPRGPWVVAAAAAVTVTNKCPWTAEVLDKRDGRAAL